MIPRSKHLLPYLNGLPAEQMEVSPDGKWLAYTDGWASSGRAGPTAVNQCPLASSASSPRWSPDGKRITLGCVLSRVIRRSFVVEAEGGEAERVVPEDENTSMPSWAGDKRGCAGLWRVSSSRPRA